MILGAEVALIVLGLMALFKGKLTLSKTKVVYGGRARLLSLICFAPLPLTFFTGLMIGLVVVIKGGDVNALQGPDWQWKWIGLEAAVVVLCGVLLYAVGNRWAENPQAPRPQPSVSQFDFQPDDGNPFSPPQTDNLVRRTSKAILAELSDSLSAG